MKTTCLPRLALLALLAFSLALSGCASQPPPAESGELQGNLAISGAWALYPMMTRWAEEFQKLHPGVQFDVSAGGAGKGMADALAGAVDIGMVSRAVTPEEEAKGAYWIAVTKDAVFPMVSSKNPVLADLLAKGVTQEIFIGIFITGEITTWGQVVGRPEVTDEIHVYTRSDACGAAETWAKYLGDKKQEDLLGIGVFGDPGLLEAVVKDPLGIGYNNLGYAYDASSGAPVAGSAAIPIDANQNGQADAEELLETKAEATEMVATGIYPSPPARALNLVTNGKPGGLAAEFIRWILTDGQQFVGEAGYAQLTQEQLDQGLEKLR
ncbi:MAG: substrate-binding domain-containing protein [Anaerolineales bacterium]|nr:substrate-binding domain-containing protein [Anaerolineales bacterium]